MSYRKSDIDLLNDTLKIEEVVGEYVELKKSGSNYKGLCPFHPDNNPSFVVTPSKNICKCFVCGAGGNPVNFYAKYNNMSFLDAVGELAKKYDIPIKSISGNQNAYYEKYYKIMEEAHQFYKNQIFERVGVEALEYISNRNVKPSLIEEYGLGFAPHKWDGLLSYLISRGYAFEDIKTVGLVKVNPNGKSYDTFRNRIIFPIYSPNHRVIAFGGRTIEKGSDIPKYINSPDTPIFKKGKNLYGFDRSSIIKQKDYSILMEGYMDVLSALTFGFDTAIAPLGTALTEEQSQMLSNYSKNVILSFDSDDAGIMAAERASLILKKYGFNIKVHIMAGAKDPDEFLKKYGRQKFLESIKNCQEVFDFLYDYYGRGYNLNGDNIAVINKFVDEFKPFFNAVNTKLEKYLYLDKLALALGVKKEALEDTLITNNHTVVRAPRAILKEQKKEPQHHRDIIYLILRDNKNLKYFDDMTTNNTLYNKILDIVRFEDLTLIEMDKKLVLTEMEKEDWKEFILDISGEHRDDGDVLLETFKAHFREKIKENLQNLNSMAQVMQMLKIKEIEERLSNIKDVENGYGLYKEFNLFCNH